MTDLGITNGLINAGGDLIAWGEGVDNDGWKIGIADPKKKTEYISYIKIEDMAVVTSGDYERYSIIDGVRYSHIINPKTGYPSTGLISVTIICPDAELADALATTVFVLGREKGLKLINSMSLIDCIVVDDQNELTTSDNLTLNLIHTN